MTCMTQQEFLDRFKASFNAKRGDPRYDPTIDFNNDGIISVEDWITYKKECVDATPKKDNSGLYLLLALGIGFLLISES